MVRNSIAALLLPVGALLVLAGAGERAVGAVGNDRSAMLAEARPAVPPMLSAGGATLSVRFVQEGGPSDGAVRVELTPETRSLTMMEARSVAQEAFLDALNEPGLGDDIQRIRVVVRLMPLEAAGANPREEVFVFVRKGGRQWSVLAGE